MKLGVQIDRFTYPGGDAAIGPTLAAVARGAEAAGFDSLWLMDHFFQLPHIGAAEEPMLEAYSALGFVAGITERIALGTLVTGVTYRHPAVLVKTATTVDVLAGGRTYFGIGAAWYDREHEGLGIPFPPLAERFQRLEETLQIAKQMWTGNDEVLTFAGPFTHLAEPLCQPQPVHRPHPPIMIGGGGERKTLRLVARYGDACNLVAFRDLESVPHKLDVLRGHCETEGRSYAAIEKTVLDNILVTRDGRDGSLSPDAALDRLGRLADWGVDHVITKVPNLAEPDAFDVWAADVIPQSAGIAIAGR